MSYDKQGNVESSNQSQYSNNYANYIKASLSSQLSLSAYYSSRNDEGINDPLSNNPHQQLLKLLIMKHTYFKIRKLDHQTEAKEIQHPENGGENNKMEFENLKSSIQANSEKIGQLLSFFETFLKSSVQQPAANFEPNKHSIENKIECEVRDRYINLPLPSAQKLTKEDTQKWITQVCMTTFSASFHYYLTQQMTFEQTKVFCSQNILRNILRITQQFKLTDKQIQNLNNHIGEHVLQYLQKKYPLTQSNDINKALQKQLQQTNHLDLLINDFLYNSRIMFKYREDGNYNDMIMKVINQIIDMADSNSLYFGSNRERQSKQQNNYNDFQSFMSDLFENVYDEEWMTGQKTTVERNTEEPTNAKKINQEQNKQKYQQKVRGYTNYLIGRKISQNTLPYTQEQIQSKNLKIKTPAILRILTKWCEELWEKFDKQTYFTEMTQSIQLQDPQKINPFFKWMRTDMDKLALKQKQNILLFKAGIDRNSYNQQSQYLLRHLEQDNITSIPKYQKATGKFATQMVKNLHSYIILYLNRLIHGLLTVSKQFYDRKVDKSWDEWNAHPNLITFKIGDLLRCKISSKQKQIVKIFKEIKRISNSNPDKLKIVRIKDRLKQGTNDILINIKFNNFIICQIQLQVINKSKSKFIQCSNHFSHYIYQMRRSIFGPITEICNIWNNLQPRASQYEKIIKSSKAKQVKSQLCIDDKHDFGKFDLPFECSSCSKLYYHNNYIISNKKCAKCNKYKCVKCQINNMDEKQLNKIMFSQRKYKQLSWICKRTESNQIPKKGVCVKIESSLINIEFFQFTNFQGKTRLLSMKQGHVYNILTIKSPKDTQSFLQKYCVFEIVTKMNDFINLNEKKIQQFATESYLIQTYKQEKQVLILNQLKYSVPQMRELMKIDGGFDRNKKKIKRLQFSSNYIDNIEYFQCFQNLTSINVDYNHLQNMLAICKFKHLQKLQISQNRRLTVFNKQVCELQKLQEIKATSLMTSKLPQQIEKLVNLTFLKLDKSFIKDLPDTFCNLANLKEFSLKSGSLIKLPQNFGRLSNLKKINLSANKLTTLPQTFGKLSNLQVLDLSWNKFASLNDCVMSLSKLETLRLQQNLLQSLPQKLFENYQLLRTLTLNHNKLKNLPNSFKGCKNLTYLALHKNQLTDLPQSLKQCLLLSQFTLAQNKLSSIPQWFNVFQKLPPTIDLKKNCLTEFPKFIFNLQVVNRIFLQQNQITSIPDDVSKLQNLKLLMLSKNKIKSLNPKLAEIKSQFTLQLGSNQIQQIPLELAEMTAYKGGVAWPSFFQNNKIKSLKHKQLFDMMDKDIIFTNNLLECIPMDLIINKQKILTINFNNNRIKQIPRDINLFVNLNKLLLEDNLIEAIPKEIEGLVKMAYRGLCLNNNPIRSVLCIKFCQDYGDNRTLIMLKQLNPALEQIKVEPINHQVINFDEMSDSSDQN